MFVNGFIYNFVYFKTSSILNVGLVNRGFAFATLSLGIFEPILILFYGGFFSLLNYYGVLNDEEILCD